MRRLLLVAFVTLVVGGGLAALIVACATIILPIPRQGPPRISPKEEYPFDPSVRVALFRADFDGDGELEIYAVRCERTRHGEGYTGSACMTPWTVWVTITENNGNTRLFESVWCDAKPVEAYGWDDNTGDLAVRTEGVWSRVTGTAPKGQYEAPSGEIKRRTPLQP